jgi:hypothetical protein
MQYVAIQTKSVDTTRSANIPLKSNICHIAELLIMKTFISILYFNTHYKLRIFKTLYFT